MTRQYEVVYIFDSALEETAITERLARFHTLIQQDGAEPPQVSQWGKRTLAYPIKKHDTGYYVVAKFEADATALPEFEWTTRTSARCRASSPSAGRFCPAGSPAPAPGISGS
jgi:small subunit ribosomal protein S6